MTNKYYKEPKQIQTIEIEAPVLKGVKTVGYIDLQTGRGYTSKLAFLAEKAKRFGSSFMKSCIAENKVKAAKEALRDAARAFYTSAERFPLYVQFLKACANLRQFKCSLPKAIRFHLF